jgi:hypothetical protein
MKFSRIIVLFSVFGMGWMSAAVLPPTTLLPDTTGSEIAVRPAPQVEPATRDRMAQQDFGSRCSTAEGVCSLPRPQPIGSVCYCGSARGTTIR